MDISVVIPSFNHAPYLRQCIESALSQTLAPREVIVVDDGSTDESRAVIASFGAAVQAVFQENRGTYPTLNVGLHQAGCDWVAVHNDDDYWEPEKLARQAEIVARYPDVGLVHTAGRYVDEAGAPYTWPAGSQGVDYSGPPCADLLPRLLHSNPVIIPSVLVNRRAALDIGGFNERMLGVGDWEFCLRLSRRHLFGFVDEPLTVVRVHPSNSGTDPSRLHAGWRQDDWPYLGEQAMMEAARDLTARALARRTPRGEAALALASLGAFYSMGHDERRARSALLMALRVAPWRMRTYARLATLAIPAAARRRLLAHRGGR